MLVWPPPNKLEKFLSVKDSKVLWVRVSMIIYGFQANKKATQKLNGTALTPILCWKSQPDIKFKLKSMKNQVEGIQENKE